MAQRVNVVLVDDLDGKDADETVSFGLDGSNYEIDLSREHAQELRDSLERYIKAGRKAGGSGRRGKGRRSGGSSSGTSAADIRAWARENGFDVPDRGRVSAEVREAYAAAH